MFCKIIFNFICVVKVYWNQMTVKSYGIGKNLGLHWFFLCRNTFETIEIKQNGHNEIWVNRCKGRSI